MKLRPKLALILAGVVLPVMLVFGAFRIYVEKRSMRERYAERKTERVEARGEARCEADPKNFKKDFKFGYDVYAYDKNYTSANPQAPPLEEKIIEALERGEATPSVHLWWREEHTGVTAMHTQWQSSECSVLATHWPDHFSKRPSHVVKKVTTESLVASAVLLVTVLIVAGPLVRRIRRLTEEIEEADASEYRVEAETDTDDELGELARAFNEAGKRVRTTVAELAARDEALTEYVANTTHDLAIPLTVLQHRLRRLQRHLDGDEKTRELADAAMQEAHYIASLVANMGAAARLEGRGARLTRHDCELGELVERVVSRHRPIARQEGVDLNWTAPPEKLVVNCDSTLVEQALSNFVQNAIQYNEPGGHVSVLLEPDGDGFELRVIDDGPGLSEDLLDEVTERSFRATDARTRRPQGEGFGLAIANRVCELHDWTLELRNRDAGGLEVMVRG